MDETEWLTSLVATRQEKRIEKAVVDRKIAEQRAKAREIDHDIREIEERIKVCKENKDKNIILTDHALLRYIERKYNIDMDKMREEILQPNVIAAIKCGAKALETNGVKFVFDKRTIVTTLLPYMNGKPL